MLAIYLTSVCCRNWKDTGNAEIALPAESLNMPCIVSFVLKSKITKRFHAGYECPPVQYFEKQISQIVFNLSWIFTLVDRIVIFQEIVSVTYILK